MKFAAQALGVRRDSRGEAEECGKQVEAIEKDLRPFCVHCHNEFAISELSIERERACVRISKIACGGKEAERAVRVRAHKWYCSWRHMVWVVWLNL